MPERTSLDKIKLNPGDVILFQGDSITDAGRDRSVDTPNSPKGLGSGYAFLAGGKLLADHPTFDLSIYNRGVSGNKVHQLSDRWDMDTVSLKPTVLSILIGVNDYWHTLSGGYAGDINTYKNDYRKLIDNTLLSLPDVTLVIGEPFAVNRVKHVTDDWYPTFQHYQAVARDIAAEYNATFIPYQQVFDQACADVYPEYWTNDGVHTTLAGAQLMAETWLAAVQ